MSSGETDTLLDHQVVPSTPTPSTSDISISQQQHQQLQQQEIKQAFKVPDVLYSIVFSILWLFGLARNLASYVVSLGIIPLKTATRLFGIKPAQQPHPNTTTSRSRTTQSTRHTRSDKSAPGAPVKRPAWNTHTSSKDSASSTASTSTSSSLPRTSSVPSSPRTRGSGRATLVEPATDSEQLVHITHRPRNRHTAPGGSAQPTRRIVFQDEEEDEGNGRTRSRSRVDHSTRRILFVDHKHARRQTAPPVPYQSNVATVPDLAFQDVTESPVQETVQLPQEQSNASSSSSLDRPKSTSEQPNSRPLTNEFGEFVSAPVPAPSGSQSQATRFPSEQHDRDATASGTESTSERKSRGKDRLRSLFGKKRSGSVGSTTAGGEAKGSSNRLRRKSPYPAAPTAAPAPAVAVSDAESTTASTWLRSRPRKLSRKARSNSLSESARLPQPTPTTATSTSPLPPPSASLPSSSRPSTTDAPQSQSPLPCSPVPLLRSSTMASTSSSATSSSAPGPGAPGKRSSGHGGAGGFNPLRELEARLYRHGVGTGPGTHDALTYVTTPVPKTGIKRTNPYALLGMERPAVVNAPSPTSTSRPVSLPGPSSAFGTASPKPSRRVSVPVEDTMAKRPVTPRAHTQPL